MSTKTVQVKTLVLSSSIGTGNTTAIVSGMIGLDGVDLTQADFGTIIYGTLEPKTAREEAVSFTITSNTAGVANINFTASGRGLIGKSPYGTGGIAYAHSAGAKLVISNNPNLFNKFPAKDNDETITGSWSIPTPTIPANPVTKSYADALVSAGAPDASTTTKGLVRLTASPNVTIGVATVTIATPAVVSFTAHGLTVNDTIQFTTTGALPTGLVASTDYFVIATGLTANAFQLSTTLGGSAINTTGSQSGIHTLIRTTPRAVSENDTRLPTQIENDAMIGDVTPSSTNVFKTKYSGKGAIKAKVAGATINGATLPVPVYQNKTDNEFYACDANDTAAMKFIGFAITNGVDTGAIDIQFSGIVSGFTALEEGQKYYVQDTVGTIGTTIGTYEILVGVAISETELLIQKGKRHLIGNATLGDLGANGSTSDVTITTGFRPKVIRFHANSNNSGSSDSVDPVSIGFWANGIERCASNGGQVANLLGSTQEYTFTVLSVSDTNCVIRVTQLVIAPEGTSYVYEIEGEL